MESFVKVGAGMGARNVVQSGASGKRGSLPADDVV